MALRDWIGELRSEGVPLRHGEWTVTPVSRALVVQVPGLSGGLVWNRPVFVRVARAGQPERVLPIYDFTRLALIGLTLAALIGAILARIIIRKDA